MQECSSLSCLVGGVQSVMVDCHLFCGKYLCSLLFLCNFSPSEPYLLGHQTRSPRTPHHYPPLLAHSCLPLLCHLHQAPSLPASQVLLHWLLITHDLLQHLLCCPVGSLGHCPSSIVSLECMYLCCISLLMFMFPIH